MLIFNLVGLAILLGSSLVGFGISHVLGLTESGPQMMITGPVAFACDALYRWKVSARNWLHPSAGGSLFYIPVWVFGVLWFLLGILYTITGRDQPGTLGWVIIILFALVVIGTALYRTAQVEAAQPGWECTRCGKQNQASARSCSQCQLQI